MTDATAGIYRGAGERSAWPVWAQAQQSALPVVGFLIPQSADEVYKKLTVPFLQGLKEAGYVEGQNVAVEYRYAENQFDRLPALATDLVRRRVPVILAGGIDAALASKAATATIPIVFLSAADPVAMGHVASLNRPGGNLTGSAIVQAQLASKQLQLLHELIPNAALFGVLVDPASPTTKFIITGGAHAGPTTRCCGCRNRWRFRTGICNFFATGRWGGPGRQQRLLQPGYRTIRRAGGPPCAARDLPIP
jgi:hypothetical protein